MQASVHEAKTNLSKLLEAVERGERVVITKYGKPAAELIPARKKTVRFGILKDKIGEIPDSFFEQMSEEELRLWEGG
ncbi:type II toxin-antitoxin system prevent-host-death family antitoxin [Rhodophyticola sp. CCM32]|uniref:type II toxin-antitoxin system Phd/YefM family antitoxin n=1 Tax=Rhodophyticola sp. CCM32 TaxID=2916397 RepID=UPI00107F4DA4|nr:type II toxin-antitoxin system prevent-host-death family antitoxin [Rhodophyticola sp. CCM32]QBY02347.1 type II toxin-antitoxin system prevent-host-death family antitoxin [Rhodophyticola sp. CCM32]